MRSYLSFFFIYFLIFGLYSCEDFNNSAEESEEDTELAVEGTTKFYLIRHAEKDRASSDSKNPPLKQVGMARAIKWASVFQTVQLNKIYSTHYLRTMETASPTAVSKGLEVLPYDAVKLDVAAFKAKNFNNNVLVVGHSNTIPKLANALIGKEVYQQIEDHINSYLYVITIANGQTSHMVLNVDHCISEYIDLPNNQ
ncbi:MAG: histidine phosphatase family protein [Flavobacteriaceae bacterium]|nr:histidine phosphatase family protein [Flavobacteriaceae bacterium]